MGNDSCIVGSLVLSAFNGDIIIDLDRDEFRKVKNELGLIGLASLVFFEVTDVYGSHYMVNKSQVLYLNWRKEM